MNNDNTPLVDDLLGLVKFGCKTKLVDNNDWLIRALIESLRTTCTKRCVEKKYGQFHPKCTICKDVIKDIKHKIETSALEKDVQYRLESLCDILPNKEACVNYVEKYTKTLINNFIDEIKEQSVCAEIGYC